MTLAVDLEAVIARVKIVPVKVVCEEPGSDLKLFKLDLDDKAMCDAHVAQMVSESVPAVPVAELEGTRSGHGHATVQTNEVAAENTHAEGSACVGVRRSSRLRLRHYATSEL